MVKELGILISSGSVRLYATASSGNTVLGTALLGLSWGHFGGLQS